jgi:hypothetical protein
MTNLLAKKGAQAMDQPRRIHISWFGGADDASGYANFRHAIHIFCDRVPSFEGGREIMVRAGGGKRMVDFPLPAAACLCTTPATPSRSRSLETFPAWRR